MLVSNMERHGRYVPPRVFRKYVDVSDHQLRWWAKTGKIDFITSPGGNRLYKLDIDSIKDGLQKIAYCRVSSAKQKPDLERQKDFMVERFPGFKIVSDVGSGINWKRPGLLAILDAALSGTLKELAVASRDRLCRFSFELIEHVLKKQGVKITVVDAAEAEEEQDLADDLLSIVQVFCCRRNGRRRYSRAQDPKDQAQPDTDAEAQAAAVQ